MRKRNVWTSWKYAEEHTKDIVVQQKVPVLVIPDYDVELEGYDGPVTQYFVLSPETMTEDEWLAFAPLYNMVLEWAKNRMERRD